jgi:hypothetical protein
MPYFQRDVHVADDVNMQVRFNNFARDAFETVIAVGHDAYRISKQRRNLIKETCI